jgi:TonB family protein
MSRRDPTILIALFAALIFHLIILSVGVHAARQELGWWMQTPGPVLLARKPPNAAPQNPVEQLGDHKTFGASINSSPGQKPMESAIADLRQEQAMMQRDPVGFGGHGSAKQLDQLLRGDNGDGAPKRGTKSPSQTSASVFASQESALAATAPKSPRLPPLKLPAAAKANLPGPTDLAAKPSNSAIAEDPLSSGPLAMKSPTKDPMGAPAPTPSSNDADPTQQQQQKASAQQQQKQQQNDANSPNGGNGGQPGAADPGAGNPMPTSDFESFPVTHIASRFVAGKIEARTGRKMRTRELPRLGLAARADLATMDNPYVVLRLKIDETGNITDVQTIHSSGSENVDLPCERAAYTWWFEPLKDPKTGKPRPEVMEFTIYL